MYHMLVALQFLTRLPVPRDLNPSDRDMAKSAIFFPAVGVLLGFMAWATFWGLTFIGFSNTVSIVVVVTLSIFLTGGFHEDGLADTFDGLGGAFEKNKKLEIMKDSRLGTYGALALICAIILRVASLHEISENHLLSAMISSLMFGRLSSNVLISTTNYVSEQASSKSKPVINGISENSFWLPTSIYSLVACLFMDITFVCLLLAMYIVIIYALRKFFVKQIGGITGDILGAVNIIVEISTLLAFTVFYG